MRVDNRKNARERAVLAGDTSREAERVQLALWRGMSPLQKAEIVTAVSRAAQELSLAGIRQRHPQGTESACSDWLP